MRPRTYLPLLAAAFLAGLILQGPWADAQQRRTPAPAAFSSGAMRSEAVLHEISATLRVIEARLARIEAAALDGNNPPARPDRAR